jgi:hypothetical protein
MLRPCSAWLNAYLQKEWGRRDCASSVRIAAQVARHVGSCRFWRELPTLEVVMRIWCSLAKPIMPAPLSSCAPSVWIHVTGRPTELQKWMMMRIASAACDLWSTGTDLTKPEAEWVTPTTVR